MKATLLLVIVSCSSLLLSGSSRLGAETATSVVRLTEDLYGKDPSTVTKAKEKLLAMARQSAANRQEVIRRLITVLDDPRTERMNYSGAWFASADLLGDLKAEEAIDVLVRHLDYTNGVVGLSSSHVPAVKALAKIGKPAVPALSVAAFELITEVGCTGG